MIIVNPRSPLPILTTLRFFAAAEVVVFHAKNRIPLPTNFLLGLASAGYQAVTFFFVLSGFILVYVYAGLNEHDYINTPAREFWRARIARISPAYFLGLILFLPVFAYSALISKTTSIQSFLLGLILYPSFLQAWWPPVAEIWNPPAWSLSVEVFFYAFFPTLESVTSRMSRRHLIIIAYSLVVAVTAWQYVVVPPPGSYWANSVGYIPLPLGHFPQFIFGMALGRLYLFAPTVSPRNHVGMFCIGSIGLVLLFGFRSLYPLWAQTDAVLVLLFGLVIFGGARAERVFRVLTFPPIVLLGEASYAIYILHSPIEWWWTWFMQKILGLSLPALVDFLLYFALVIMVSVLCFLFVETPLRRWIFGRREHSPV